VLLVDYLVGIILKKHFNLKLKLYLVGHKKLESYCNLMAAVCVREVGVILLVDVGDKCACTGVVSSPKYTSS
jgi:hypothetical protein